MRYLLSLLLLASSAFADQAAVKALAPTLWLKSYKGLTTTSVRGVSTWADQSGNGRNFVQATAGNQPVVTRGDNKENQVLQSVNMNNASWVLQGIDTPTAQADPRGGLLAWRAALDGTTTTHNIRQATLLTLVTGQRYRTSLWMKRTGGANFITAPYLYRASPAVSLGMAINPETGAVTTTYTTGGSDVVSTVEAKGDGWWLATLEFTSTVSTSAQLNYYPVGTNSIPGTGQSVDFFEPIVQSSTSLPTYIPTTDHAQYAGWCNAAGTHCLPVVRFDGVDDGMTSPATMANIFANNAKSAYILARPRAVGTGVIQTLLRSSSGHWDATLKETAIAVHHNYDTTDDYANSGAITANTNLLISYLHLADNLYINVNGVDGTPGASGNTGSMAGTLEMGARTAGTYPFGGGILELLTFPVAHTPAQQAIVQDYLNSVWSTTATPFKTIRLTP